jgi:hypothetical protein
VLERITAIASVTAATVPPPFGRIFAALAAAAQLTAIDLRDRAEEKDRQADALLRDERREGRRGGGASSGPSSSDFRGLFAHTFMSVPETPLPEGAGAIACGPFSPWASMAPGTARRWIAMAVGLQIVALFLLVRKRRDVEKGRRMA